MPIRPVDMQVMLPKSVEVQKANQNDATRPQVQHQQFAQQIQKNVEHERQTIIQANKPEGGKVDKDGRGPGGDNPHNRRKQNKDEKGKDAQKERTSMLDISI